MSQAGSEREGGDDGASDDLTEVVAELRAELQSTTARLVRLDERIASIARTLGGQLQQVESQLVQLAARATALDDIQQGLGRTREAVAGLATRADRADAAGQRLADDQAFALARVTAATDALGSTVSAMRAALTTLVETSRDAAVDAVDERIGARLDESSTRVEETIAARLEEALAGLGITQLRRSIAEVAEQVVESRGDARTIDESIKAVDARVAQTIAIALLPVTTAIGRVRQQLETAAAGTAEIAEGLADALRAEISEQLGAAAQGTAAMAEDLADSLRSALTKHLAEKLTESDAARQAGMEQLALQLTLADAERQAGIEELSVALRQQLSRADEQRTAFTEQVTHQLSQADVARHAGIESILTEVTATREATERRSGSRRRRRDGDDPAVSVRSVPSDHEQRVDQALRDLDHRLIALAEIVERASAFADDAAQASIATFRAVTAPPAAPSPAPAKRAPRKAAAKASTAKKTTATKRATKATAKRSPTRKATSPDDPAD